MSYSGGDGQTLGIILTPRHITELFCDLLNLKPEDKVMDPCCGGDGDVTSDDIFLSLQKKEKIILICPELYLH